MNEQENLNLTKRQIRSYVIRNGRITPGQNKALENIFPKYELGFSTQALNPDAAFGRAAPLWIEIGFGNGVQTAHIAKQRPEINLLGIEIHLAGIGHLLKLADDSELENLKIMRHDAVEVLANSVADNSLDRLLLFFPDPWPKKKHHKRRIIQPEFIELVTRKLKPGGYFHLATDWQPYALWMLEHLNASTLHNLSPDNTYCEKPDYRMLTKFENRGIKKGHGVWDLLYQKV